MNTELSIYDKLFKLFNLFLHLMYKFSYLIKNK